MKKRKPEKPVNDVVFKKPTLADMNPERAKQLITAAAPGDLKHKYKYVPDSNYGETQLTSAFKHGTGNKILTITNKIKRYFNRKASELSITRKFCNDMEIDPNKNDVADCMAQAIIAKALTGDAKIIDMIWHRLEGAIIQRTEVQMNGKLGISEALKEMKLNRKPAKSSIQDAEYMITEYGIDDESNGDNDNE